MGGLKREGKYNYGLELCLECVTGIPKRLIWCPKSLIVSALQVPVTLAILRNLLRNIFCWNQIFLFLKVTDLSFFASFSAFTARQTSLLMWRFQHFSTRQHTSFWVHLFKWTRVHVMKMIRLALKLLLFLLISIR